MISCLVEVMGLFFEEFKGVLGVFSLYYRFLLVKEFF